MKKRHTPEQIVRKLRQADAELAAGTSVPEVARRLGVSEATFHRWRNQYGGMKADAMKRLKELEAENARLKKIVADQSIDLDILKEVNRKKWMHGKRKVVEPDGLLTAYELADRVCKVFGCAHEPHLAIPQEVA